MKRINFWIGMVGKASANVYRKNSTSYIVEALDLRKYCVERLHVAIQDHVESECEKAQEWVISDLACKGIDYYGI
jgi:glutaredoxin 2